MPSENSDNVRDKVREGYAQIARSGQWSGVSADADEPCCAGGCCGPTTASANQVAAAVGYDEQTLADLPDGANLGLSCGNPTAVAALRPGQVVLDLGSGAGFDCFIAAPRVGAEGRVIGVDMTPDMLTKARENLRAFAERTGLHNVEFRLGEIEHLPLPDNSVDVVISNCVINLSPDKPQVWREIARVLKPGGRVAVSDLALLKPLPPAVVEDLQALIGCIAGATLVEDTRRFARDAGLTNIELAEKPGYVNAMESWQDPLYRKIIDALPGGESIADYVTSLDATAAKP